MLSRLTGPSSVPTFRIDLSKESINRYITVLLTGEGGATLLLDTGECKAKTFQQLFDNTTYRARVYDPTQKQSKTFQN